MSATTDLLDRVVALERHAARQRLRDCLDANPVLIDPATGLVKPPGNAPKFPAIDAITGWSYNPRTAGDSFYDTPNQRMAFASSQIIGTFGNAICKTPVDITDGFSIAFVTDDSRLRSQPQSGIGFCVLDAAQAGYNALRGDATRAGFGGTAGALFMIFPSQPWTFWETTQVTGGAATSQGLQAWGSAAQIAVGQHQWQITLSPTVTPGQYIATVIKDGIALPDATLTIPGSSTQGWLVGFGGGETTSGLALGTTTPWYVESVSTDGLIIPGPAGPQGPQGAQGPQGIPGPQGPAGSGGTGSAFNIAARGHRNAAFNFNTNGVTELPIDTVDYDVSGGFLDVTTNHCLLIPAGQGGVYAFTGNIGINPIGNNARYIIALHKNGAEVSRGDDRFVGSGQITSFTVTDLLQVAAGDKIAVALYASSTGPAAESGFPFINFLTGYRVA